MLEVAIKSVEAVFDWKNYLYEEFGYEVDESWMKDGELSEPDEEDENEEAVAEEQPANVTEAQNEKGTVEE